MTLDDAMIQISRRLFALEKSGATISWEESMGVTHQDGQAVQNGTASFIVHINGGAADIEQAGDVQRITPKVLVIG